MQTLKVLIIMRGEIYDSTCASTISRSHNRLVFLTAQSCFFLQPGHDSQVDYLKWDVMVHEMAVFENCVCYPFQKIALHWQFLGVIIAVSRKIQNVWVVIPEKLE